MSRLAPLVVVALAVVAVLLWRDADAPARPGGESERSAVRETAARTSASAIDPQDTEEPARRALGSSEKVRTIAVRVVDAADGSPLAGIGVVLRQSSSDEAHVRATTNATGSALVAFPVTDGIAELDAEGWYAGARFDEDTSDVRLVARRVLDLFVRATDHAGAPLPGFAITAADRVRGTSGTSGTTDGDGLAQLRIGEIGEGPWVVAPGRWIGPDPGFPRAHGATSRERPVELRVPAFGSVRVRVVRGGRAVDHHDARVTATLVTQPGSENPTWTGTGSQYARRDNGEYAFDQVAAGEQLEIRAFFRGVFGRATIDGPRFHGDIVRCEIDLGGLPPLVELRLLAPDGQPLGRTHVTVRLAGDSVPAPSRTRSDADGLVTVELGPRTSMLQRIEVWTDPSIIDFDDPVLFGTLEVGRTVDADARLGDLHMSAVPSLLWGRVTHRGGAPVSGARLTVLRILGDSHAPTSLRTRSNSDGRYRIKGPWPEGLDARAEYVLRAERDDLVPSVTSPLSLGNRVDVVLGSGGGVVARIADPHELYRMALVPWLMDASGRHIRCESTQEDDGHTHRWTTVPPGRVAFVVSTHPGGVPLASIEDVIVREGETTRDRRLDPVTIGEHLRSVTVRVTEGARPSDAIAWRGDGDRWAGVPLGTGCEVRMPVRKDGTGLGLVVDAPGSRPVFVAEVTVDMEIRMQPDRPLRVSLTGLPDGVDSSSLSFGFARSGDGLPLSRLYRGSRVGSGAAQPLELPLPPAGRFPVELRLANEAGPELLELPQPLVVPEEYDGATITVELDEVTRARLVEALAR